ncbi:hypothetical protein FU139_30395 [Burkholderia territorii]|nr:hypothetical protein FU139_30395 [Burkholderia territorii]
MTKLADFSIRELCRERIAIRKLAAFEDERNPAGCAVQVISHVAPGLMRSESRFASALNVGDLRDSVNRPLPADCRLTRSAVADPKRSVGCPQSGRSVADNRTTLGN